MARRQKKTRRAKGFPTKTSVLKDALDILMYPVAIIAPLALLPQVIKLYTSQDPSGLALSTWLILGFLNIIWLVYGHVHREPPITLTNFMLGVLNFAIVFGILLFR